MNKCIEYVVKAVILLVGVFLASFIQVTFGVNSPLGMVFAVILGLVGTLVWVVAEHGAKTL